MNEWINQSINCQARVDSVVWFGCYNLLFCLHVSDTSSSGSATFTVPVERHEEHCPICLLACLQQFNFEGAVAGYGYGRTFYLYYPAAY